MPFAWNAAYYCMDLREGTVRHFPEGTYNAQMASAMGKNELQMIETVYRAWRTFIQIPMAKWGDLERRVASLAMPDVKPEEPTRRLDSLIMMLWPGSLWSHALTMRLRGLDDG